LSPRSRAALVRARTAQPPWFAQPPAQMNLPAVFAEEPKRISVPHRVHAARVAEVSITLDSYRRL
jgi:hypothetical protein